MVLYLKDGGASAEFLPPVTEQAKSAIEESAHKFRDAFAELKRLCD